MSDQPPPSSAAPISPVARKTIAAFVLLAIAPLGFWGVLRLPGEHFMLLQVAATLPIVVALSLLISVFKLRETPKWKYVLLLCALFFLVMSAGSAFLAHHIYFEDMEFEAHAVPGVALVTKTLIAPDGITHRIHIQIQGDKGKIGQNNIEIEPAFWKTIKVGSPFPVNYVPQNPDNNRPTFTGFPPKTTPSPLNMVIASLMGFLGFIATALPLIKSFKADKTHPTPLKTPVKT